MTLNQGWIYRDRIQPADEGKTVLEFYGHHYRHSTSAQWRDRIQQGQIHLDGHPTTATTRLQRHQHLTYHRPPWHEPTVPLGVEILHRDHHFWIIHKPSGLPVMPGGNFLDHTLLHQLRRQFPQEKLTPIHRLGRGTSGLMILGRSTLGRQRLTHQLRHHQITKIYRALIPPGPYPQNHTITQPIGPVPHPILGTIFAAHGQGKPAISEVTILQQLGDRTLVAVRIPTGRPHQIRIHLAWWGFPLIGDPLYGVGGVPKTAKPGEKIPLPGDCGYWLHAHCLKFRHPETEKLLRFTADPPAMLAIAPDIPLVSGDPAQEVPTERG